MDKCRVIIEFPNEDFRKAFLVWFCDGGGDDNYCTMLEQESLVDFEHIMAGIDYKKAFEAWGYDPKKHGPDKTIEVTVYHEE